MAVANEVHPMSALFQPIEFRGLRLENRIMVSPMCQYSASDGSASDWHLIHLGHLALGGAGILFVEATAVNPVARITPACLGLYSDANEAALARVVGAVRANSDMPLGIQLAHAGRKGSSRAPWEGGTLIPTDRGGWLPVAPSAAPHSEAEPPPHALTRPELEGLKRDFAASTRRADRLGFEAVELHAAHGYLLHEFLSPLANRRDDEYGGKLENRMRLTLEVFAAMRSEWPERKPMGVRLSATDWVEGGWDLAQTIALARELKALGCDWIDASSGGVSPAQKIALGPGYQVPFAQAIRKEAAIPTIAVGLITGAQQAEDIVAGGKADMVALARAMLYDPRWAWHAAAELGAQVRAPEQYWRCPPHGLKRPLFREARSGQR
jgi:2,4-dienoyl-CoA reductase-like NADH-dependent reductase (Old Yellow Enzyme family)